VPWFGKPTFVLFTAVQGLALLVDAGVGASRSDRSRARLAFAAGGVIGGACMVALLCVYGDPVAYVRIQLTDVPNFYRFIWPRAPSDIFSLPWAATQAIFALSGAAALLALIALGQMPLRLLPIALLPVVGLVSVIVQAKGFPYHYHPVVAGFHLQWLAFAAWVTERARVAQRRLAFARILPVAVAVVVTFRVATALEDSPHVRATWMVWASTIADRTTRDYFARFPERDYFPYEMRQAAEYLRTHTKDDDRVQIYGMDPYVLFLAARLSATPYIYAYDLDVDAGLAGSTGGAPNAAQAQRIRGIAAADDADLLTRLEAHAPAAFVFFDGAPLMTEFDAWDDFSSHCDASAPWVHEHYREAARFGHDHVWLRNDLVPPGEAPAEAAPDREEEKPD
ncbi:MAG TPA: hypothetical protein VHV30_06735, partial [Polyangiaceae bacterium]|nr:hypothetical protein [Polyangiaceae bacterium]